MHKPKIEKDLWIYTLKKETFLNLLFINNKLGLRISELFLEQLKSGISDDSIHAQTVIQEIKALEGVGNSETKLESMFRGNYLNGIYKKHFYQTSFLGHNLINEWKINNKKSNKFEEMVKNITKKYKDPYKASELIANKFVNAIHERESKRNLTGEWIVFTKWKDKNYYLTIASHKEENETIRKRITNHCTKQFPFINDILD